ncbi:protein-disulfide reductase DsbD family protein [Brevundimonas sp. SL130]|uniref:protein-disulfide reductase DsbD family protein n=1 Tax=Brevundimonas sp. SL130 TaxID=2995143 RepID=UPI00226C9927|nr:thioredoxin family protein [Brevundimonas sp. SL130]WAC60022.1 protein-disulfide reductase DsbD family protein [Brevundimonas sp. SL130]
MRAIAPLFALCLLVLSGGWISAAAQPVSRPAQTATPVSAGPRQADNIEAELVSLSQWAAPGSTVVVAVRQEIAPGWHTYWRNPGDSGGPTTLDWRLPPGVKAGEIVWPLPSRQRLMSLVNYGYSGEVYLPVPIEVPASARPGTVLPLTADVLFLVCSDQMCVPVQMSLRLDLPIREGAPPLNPDHGAALEAVLAAAPRPAGIEARATLIDGVLTLSATGGPLSAALADGEPTQAVFYPFEGGVIDHAAAQSGQTGPNGLSLRLIAADDLKAKGLNGPISGVLATDAGAWEITARPGPVLAGAAGGRTLSGEVETPAPAKTGLMLILQSALFALIGGLILNLMPCVFPILAMKAAALAASAHDAKTARRDGLLFMAGVLASFLVLAVVLLVLRAGGEAIGWGFQLQSPAVIAGLALLMLAVGLNLSGVFQVGAGVQAVGAGPLSRLPGGVGAFFTGVLAVVVAAPCTAPFMAVALGAALLMPWPAALLVFLMLGLGLGLPYLAVSLSPGLLRRFPRPGPWMDRLKGLLAFPMYGAALWLVWVFSRQTSAEALALFLAAALMLAFGLWLTGVNQTRRGEGGTAVVSAVAAALAIFFTLCFAGLAASRAQPPANGSEAGPLAAAPWSAEAVGAAQAQGRPVLVNFTADWCVTCKINERAALSSPRVAEALQAANAVYLVGDWTRRDDAITRELERHGRSGVPLYLLYPASGGEPRILPQLLTEGVVTDALQTARTPNPAP